MSRRRRGDPVSGVVLFDKPAGLSSNQALQRVRRLFNARKAGHTGTLDPFATGLLPLCLGEASKTTSFLLAATKAYRAQARLGEATSTGDPEGEVVATGPVPEADAAAVAAVLEGLTGAQEQVPPMFSAIKHEGRPLYEYARRGETVPRKPRPVVIFELALLHWLPPVLEFEVVCSKGTYVRTLAEDMAAALGTVAHLRALRRLRVGPFPAEDMVTLDELEAAAEAGGLREHLLPVDAGLADWPVVRLDAPGARAFAHGNPAPVVGEANEADDAMVRVRDAEDRLLGLGEVHGTEVRPKKVFQREEMGGEA